MMQVLTVTNTYTLVRRYRPPRPQRPTLIRLVGYYIHTCQKMKYKGEYSPSYLLDPVRVTSSIFLFSDRTRRNILGTRYRSARRSWIEPPTHASPTRNTQCKLPPPGEVSVGARGVAFSPHPGFQPWRRRSHERFWNPSRSS